MPTHDSASGFWCGARNCASGGLPRRPDPVFATDSRSDAAYSARAWSGGIRRCGLASGQSRRNGRARRRQGQQGEPVRFDRRQTVWVARLRVHKCMGAVMRRSDRGSHQPGRSQGDGQSRRRGCGCRRPHRLRPRQHLGRDRPKGHRDADRSRHEPASHASIQTTTRSSSSSMSAPSRCGLLRQMAWCGR